MIALGRVETPAGLDLGDDRSGKRISLVELADIGLGNVRLLRICRENCRAILSPDIRALAVEFGRIMGDRKIDLQDMAVADAAGIEGDLDRFRVAGRVGAYHLVVRRIRSAAGITGDGAGDALDMLKHTLDAPEAAAGEYRDLGCRLRVDWFVDYRRRDRAR